MTRATPLLIFILILTAGFSSPDETSKTRIAIRELARRAETGDPKSLYDLASLHDKGYDSIQVDSARSTTLYRLSATKGYARAQNYLGFRYFKGEYVKQNVDSALFWITKAASAGDISAANNLGYLLTVSNVLEHDYTKGAYWLGKAADAGMPQAQSLLADLYRKGLGMPPDTAKATYLYDRAIEGGLHDAALKLISMMNHKWEKLPPDSAVNLGRYYYTHHAPSIGVRLFKIAAAYDDPNALALLGDAYSKGKGTDYNHHLSNDYFLRAATLGQPSAQFIIAELIEIFPDALPDSIPPASYWYGKAETAGVTDAATAEKTLLGY